MVADLPQMIMGIGSDMAGLNEQRHSVQGLGYGSGLG